ncbi:putative PHD type zinc finger protein with BAH domain-containing protein [Steccherinum ochraceum]|uniref:Putative PHD type zinc finger protein with BAH domain-containing protein n=1 Tax=Steccherinum ochraceum TaxID=92696 RepID=A0A4R0RVM8_9APHY|nr:putative PHD type zinc finger protein with BAH domain-containing protein [Steccherinum ochraceum]
MPSPASSISVTLKSGEQVKVNDHVYCSPSWSIRDGTPYSIARIMEFLPAPGVPTFDASGKRSEPLTRVRLAWYYRPGDVSDRNVADSRLLLAAIYSEVCELSQLRAKCHVIHRDKISDLAGWKKRPDRFYFTRLFDPWIRKEFEVIQASSVRNLPEHIRDTLVSRYEYVVAEKEIVPDLTDDVRNCATCDNWCPPCKNFFHMACVTPPLLAKPSRGYGWTCAPCSRQHEEEVEGHERRVHALPAVASTKPKSNAPAPRARGRPRKDRTLADKQESVEIKHFNMWPFRYFGQYTVAEDTLNPDDLIFPRAATRVGPKYQVSSLPIPGTDANGTPSSEMEERGGDGTIEVLSAVNDMTPEEMAALDTYNNTLTNNKLLSHNVDWLSESIRRFSDAWAARKDLATVNMQSPVRFDKWKKTEVRYMDREWTEVEKAGFEDAILAHGAELRPVREEIATRTMYEVVRYYGHWKSSKLGEENRRIKAARLSGLDAPARPPSRTVSDDGDSVVHQPSKNQQMCSSCRTRESTIWWKAPKAVHPNGVLCDNCGISWRKYGELSARPIREELPPAPAPPPPAKAVKPVEAKREGTPLTAPNAKRQRTTSLRSTPPVAAPAAPQIRCLACHKLGPSGKVLKCMQCSTRVHAGVCGVGSDPVAVDGWTCDICTNETTQEASVIPDCLLCPRPRRDPKKQPIYPPPDSFLRSCKPTEGQAWVHTVCSVFIPEVLYSDASRLRLVEGISTIPVYRWMNKCTLCDQDGGAVVRCSDCPAEYHVSCAWRAGHKFGFEVQTVKASRRDTTIMVDFKEASGCMVPVVTCKGHPPHRREMFGICEVNELGETALQVYCKTYKQVALSNAHGLLRKAQRLDQIINAEESSDSDSTLIGPDPKCHRCTTEFSPTFYPSGKTPAGATKWLCHKCHWDATGGASVMVNGNVHGDDEDDEVEMNGLVNGNGNGDGNGVGGGYGHGLAWLNRNWGEEGDDDDSMNLDYP